jgi:hypothetical protein
MRRVAGWLLPLALAVVGAALIVAAGLNLDPPSSTLPPIPDPTPTPVAQATPTRTPSATASLTPEATPTATISPSPSATPPTAVAVQLEVPSLAINVAVKAATSEADCLFPPADAAYLICGGSQPGRGTNSYIFAHAIPTLFKNLWNAQLGEEVKVLLSDGRVLRYVVTEVRPNVPCPDPEAPPHPNPPLALQYAPDTCADASAWTAPTPYERLTLQTSQGFNRNWGELVIVAEPLSG